jgi:hypothetical protein
MLKMARISEVACFGLVSLAFATGCGSLGTGAEDSAALVASEPIFEPRAPLAIEESDLYRVEGSWLFVQSARSGLNVIDVSAPRAPKLVQQVPIRGRAGELYADQGAAFVLLTEASPPCRLGAEFQSGLIATTSQRGVFTWTPKATRFAS